MPKYVLNFVVNQDPSDPVYFQVIQRFPGPSGMVAHQSGPAYGAFVRAAQPLLAESLGVYLCKESDGKIGQALYPWGPKGEGGRDDMVVRLGLPVPRRGSGPLGARGCSFVASDACICAVLEVWLPVCLSCHNANASLIPHVHICLAWCRTVVSPPL